MTEIKETINKNVMEDNNLIESDNKKTINFYKTMLELFNRPKTEAEIEYEKTLVNFVVMCMKEKLELSTLQHQIDYKNKLIELKVSNLFEKGLDIINRSMPNNNKDEDKRFIDIIEKILDVCYTNKNKQINNKEK